MRRWFVLLALACVGAAPAEPQVSVAVARGADGGWTVDYAFPEQPRAWAFVRSNPDWTNVPWRQLGWTVETPGVTLIRAGEHDALVADGAMPTKVRIRFKPFSKALRADYTPALAFSDGGVALYSDHFTVAPRASIAAVATDDGGEVANIVTFSDPGKRLVAKGKVLNATAVRERDDPPIYVYSGDAPIVETPAIAAIFDPGLPTWLRAEVEDFVPKLFGLYRARLGDPKGNRPMAMIAWRKDGQGGANASFSFSGSVLPGLVVMDLGGKAAAQPSAEVATKLRWFLGHESSHFWMGETLGYASRGDAWITEGSADLMAIRALETLKPGYDARAELQKSLDECLLVNGREPLGTAERRGVPRANYACGAMLALAAEAAERRQDPNADVFTWLRRLMQANRAKGRIDTQAWAQAYAERAGDRVVARRVIGFVSDGVADPAAFLAELFTTSGVKFARAGDTLNLL
ncbi:MAG: hypothetical protein V4659_12065 [Pseudomonadota bacterium]